MNKNLTAITTLSIVLLGSLVSCGGQSSSETNPSSQESAPTSQTSSVAASTFDKTKNVKLYTRNTDSGTRDGFFTGIGLSSAKEDNGPLAAGFAIADSNGDMINLVKNDEYGIGYISLSTLADSGVKGLSYEGVNPTEENVLNDSYKLTRNFNYIIRSSYADSTKESIVNAFIAYLGTQNAKAIMQSDGGILSIKASDPTWDSIKANYAVAAQDNSAITINFGGSTSVSKMATALATSFSTLCGNVKFSHDYHGSGDAYKKTQGASKDETGNYDIAFASREFNLTSSEPAADNTYGRMCIDAIVPVVNEKNECTAITKDLLKDMYTGVKTKWSEIY